FGQAAQEFTCTHVPHLHPAPATLIRDAERQRLAVGRECHRVDAGVETEV
ncbi:hypothetical protein HLX87_25865, partial [Escherichia coli]|nr:hypothetical protein [Escherichia coli]